MSAVHTKRTAYPVPLTDVSADQRRCVVRDRIELSTFRFSGQPRQALCRPAKRTSLTSETALGGRCGVHASRSPGFMALTGLEALHADPRLARCR
jgi:hypothetical protein